jgi:alpha-L-arabinofuranosidase
MSLSGRGTSRGESTEIRQGDNPPDNQLPAIGPRGKALSVTYVAVNDTVVLPGAKRLGMNLGSRDIYGSAQMMKNIIPNPGFEAGEYGTLFHTGGDSTGNTYYQEFWDTTWNIDHWGIGQPEGFWDGGKYEVLSGAAKGRTGDIAHFSFSADNRYVFELADDGIPADYLDCVSARKTLDGISGYPGMDLDAIDTTTTRPGSPGTQSFHLRPQAESWMASYALYMDSFWRDSDRAASKMMIVEGPWRLAFWAKGANTGTQIRVEFRREGEGVFFNETVNLTTEWQRFEFNRLIPTGQDRRTAYTVDDYHPLLVLKYYVLTGAEAWIDDAELCRSDQSNPTAFNDAIVGKLKELRPGVLRDWGNQLGSSLDNQLAEPFARKTLGWRPHNRNAGEFSYSLHEFLELCKEVAAEPWYVIPPTWTHQEMIDLCEYLCAPADGAHPYADYRAELGQVEPWSSVFPTIHLEWGNEMWGAGSGSDPFFGASALGGERLGTMAHDHFGTMKDYGPYFDPAKFDFVIGGQVGWPGRQGEIERYSSNHNTVALAPYFGSLADVWGSDQEIFAPLLAKPFYEAAQGNMRQSKNYLDAAGQGTRVSIYEINFHTTGDETPIDIRNDFVTSMAGGVAMPLFMLHYMKEFGAREQCAFQALQFSFNPGSGGAVRIWGCLRDLNLTGRKRPTWLGMEIANKAIRGDMIQTVHTGKKTNWTQSAINSVYSPTTVDHVQSYAFKDGSAYGVVLFNLSLTDSQRVRLALPNTPGTVAKEYRLAATSPHADNEDAENILIKPSTVTRLKQFYYTTLAPCSIYVLTWNSAI